MDTKNFVEENQPKLKFPIGAALLIFFHSLNLIDCIEQIASLSITFWIVKIIVFSIAILVLMRKRGIAPLIAVGAFLACEAIGFISNLSIALRLNSKGLGLLIGTEIPFLLMLTAIVLFLLCDFNIPAIKNNKKIISILLYASTVLYILFTLISIDFILLVLINNSYLIGTPIAWLLIGMYLADPYKKIPSPKSAPKNATEVCADAYYVSLGKHICLLLFTCGIWSLIWIYKATKYTNLLQGEAERNPTNKLLLCMFVPFYSIYWTYKTALRIDAMAKKRGISSDLGTVCLILAIFVGIVPPILMQEKINTLVTSK